MRTRPRVDGNHREIVEGLRQIGCSVQSLASIGGGCPDLLVAKNGKMFLFEIKDPSRSPSKRKFNDLQVAWKVRWQAPVHLIESLQGAIYHLNY